MGKNSNYSDLISSYLDRELSPNEEHEFHSMLQTDPLLKSEFELQQDIINGIKNYRRIQLKQRLNYIEIKPDLFNHFINYKIASSIIIASLLSAGSYFFFQTQNTNSGPEIADEYIINLENEVVIDNYIPDKPEPKVKVINNLVAEKNEGISKPESKEKVRSKEKTKAPVAKNEVQVIKPNILFDFGDEDISSPNDKTVSKTIEAERNNNIHNIEIENKVEPKYQFHYQFFNNKLFLYGDFSNTPYEILELHTKKEKKIYLYHEGTYYYIRKNKERITPMEAVTHQRLIKDLNIIKDNKN